MKHFLSPLHAALVGMLLILPALVRAQGIDAFAGSYAGSATLTVDGKEERREMRTTIGATDAAFFVRWTSVTLKDGGQSKEKTYEVAFIPSPRPNIFGSAMKNNVFGKPVPLDPLAGEPFVWARLEGPTLSVFSLGINEAGEYELQEFHRTLADGGLDLVFLRVMDGTPQKEIRTFLARQD